MPKRNKNYLLERKVENQARSIKQLSEALAIAEKKLDEANGLLKEQEMEIKEQIEHKTAFFNASQAAVKEIDRLNEKIKSVKQVRDEYFERYINEKNKTLWQKFKEGFKRD